MNIRYPIYEGVYRILTNKEGKRRGIHGLGTEGFEWPAPDVEWLTEQPTDRSIVRLIGQ